MINGGKLLGLVPARGGSKRLKRKNILSFAGQPLISWTIKAGLASKFVDRLIVTTEDREIAAVSEIWGADVPFMRPAELARDTTGTIDVIFDALKQLESMADRYEYLILLQPTSPLRTTQHIDESIELFLEKKANSVIGVTKLDHPIEWSASIPDDLSMSNFFPTRPSPGRSQNYPTRYRINGAIYLARISRIMSEASLFLKQRSFAYKMNRSHSVDIDTEEDFIIAEFLLNSFRS
jgi:CMP-N-acetylneuraminic acid synthetase